MTKKHLSRMISFVLVFALLFSLFPGSVFAQNSNFSSAGVNDSMTKEGETPVYREESTDAEVSEEILEGRGEFQKEFLLENGQKLLALYPRAVHFEENGEWKDIDNTLKLSEKKGVAVYTNTAGVWEVRLPQTLSKDSFVEVSYGGYTLGFSFAGKLSSGKVVSSEKQESVAELAYASRDRIEDLNVSVGSIVPKGEFYSADSRAEKTLPQTTESAIEYSSVYSGVDLRYDLLSNVLKESLVIGKAPSGNETYIYNITAEGLTLSVLDDGSILATAENGEGVFRMPAPYVQDAEGAVSFDVDISLERSGGGWILAYTVPYDWMIAEERQYPVILDPVVHPEITIANTEDQSVFERKTEPYGWGIIECGRYSGYGVSRFFIKYKNLPTLTAADYVTGATISIYKLQNSGVSAVVNVHKVEGNWDHTTLNWSNKPGYDTIIEDHQTVMAAGWYSWDVTDIVRSWYADGDNIAGNDNYGMMFKTTDAIENGSSDNWKQFCSSNYGGVVMPVLYVSYINNCGLEGYWDYTTQSAGRAGTGYVNSYTGNLVWVADGLGFAGLRMPVSISHVYNANDRSSNFFGMGNGWRTNYNQLVYQWETDSDYYVWEDEDGTRRYFKYASSGKYEEESGSGLVLTTTGSGNNKYCITDKSDNKSWFDDKGRLYSIVNNQATESSITVSYAGSDSKFISGITDGAGRYYSFAYQNNKLSSVTFKQSASAAPTSSLTYSFSGTDLVGITYPDGQSVSYTYTDHLLTRATDIDGVNVRYTYATEEPHRVTGISVYDGSVCGGEMTISYGQNQTVFTDHNGNREIMQFNDWGNTVSIQDELGRAQFSEYASNKENDTGKTNQLLLSSKLQNTVNNIINNSGFEYIGLWSLNGSAATTGSWGYTTAESYMGSQSLYITRTENNTMYAVQTAKTNVYQFKTGDTYTFSAYVKGTNLDQNGSGIALGLTIKGIGGFVTKSSYTKLASDWTRIEFTYTFTQADGEFYLHLINYSVGTAYFDCVQVEKSPTASRYNLVENGDFAYSGSSSDVAYGWEEGEGCRDTEDRITLASGEKTAAPVLNNNVYSMTGDYDRQKRSYQDISVSGSAGDVYTLAGWAKGDSVPLTDGTSRRFSIVARFYNTDGTTSETVMDFNSDVGSDVGWQYAAKRVVAKKNYSSMRLLICYESNANTVYFDGIQLFFEEFGHSYVYDDDGNVVSVTDLQKEKTEYKYENNDLTKLILPSGATQTYTYDDHHNVLTATSPAGVVSVFTYDTYGNNTSVSVGGTGTKITVTAAYGNSGNTLSSVTDALGNTTYYGYNAVTGVCEYVRAPGETAATQTNYTYDSLYRTSGVSQGSAACTYAYEDDLISAIGTASGTEYDFAYGVFGLVSSVKAGNSTLVSHSYSQDKNLQLTRSDYGNGDYVTYAYDTYGRLVSTGYEDIGTAAEYSYDSNGELGMVADKISGRTTKYSYDMSGRLMAYESAGSGYSFGVKWSYDDLNNLSSQTYTLNGNSHTTSYTYDSDNRVSKKTNGNVTSNYTYDAYSRLTGVSGTKVNTSLVYKNRSSTELTTQISGWNVSSSGGGYSKNLTYTYDAKGNITSVSDGTYTTGYVYDGQSQLVRENNQAAGKTWVYAYDQGGNILSKKEYAYTTGNLGTAQSTVNYSYGGTWKDLLTGYNGAIVSSDEIGNILSDGTWTYTWRHGRQLASASNGTTNVSYTYDADGLRTGKTVGSTATKYYYLGTQLTDMTVGSVAMHFTYDELGPESVSYNGSTYYYVKNAQGDVIAIVNSSGSAVVEYTYDAWGKLLTVTGSMASTLGSHNPLRYRGYVYDTETGLYYLQTRYYDPDMCRFICADGQLNCNAGLLGTNQFAYCYNNPVNMYDSDGREPVTISMAAIAQFTITMLLGIVVIYTIDCAESNDLGEKIWDAFTALVDTAVTPRYRTRTNDDSKTKDMGDAFSVPHKTRKDPVHHIVAQYDKRAKLAQIVLSKALIDRFTDPANLVQLPAHYHAALHTSAYYEYVNNVIFSAYEDGGRDGVYAALAVLKWEISSGAIW